MKSKLIKKPAPKLSVEEVEITTIKSHPRNVRVHPEDNIQAIMKSLDEFGQRKPLVVWKNFVICGNGTLESAKRLGWKAISITRCDDMNEDRAEAFAIADNKTTDMSEFDFEALASSLRNLEGKGIDLDVTGFQQYEREPLLQAEWNPGAPGEMPADEQGMKTLKFTDEEYQHIKEAIEFAKANLSEQYDTTTDAAALVAFCFSALK
jgi:hypothetical protein